MLINHEEIEKVVIMDEEGNEIAYISDRETVSCTGYNVNFVRRGDGDA